MSQFLFAIISRKRETIFNILLWLEKSTQSHFPWPTHTKLNSRPTNGIYFTEGEAFMKQVYNKAILICHYNFLPVFKGLIKEIEAVIPQGFMNSSGKCQ